MGPYLVVASEPESSWLETLWWRVADWWEKLTSPPQANVTTVKFAISAEPASTPAESVEIVEVVDDGNDAITVDVEPVDRVVELKDEAIRPNQPVPPQPEPMPRLCPRWGCSVRIPAGDTTCPGCRTAVVWVDGKPTLAAPVEPTAPPPPPDALVSDLGRPGIEGLEQMMARAALDFFGPDPATAPESEGLEPPPPVASLSVLRACPTRGCAGKLEEDDEQCSVCGSRIEWSILGCPRPVATPSTPPESPAKNSLDRAIVSLDDIIARLGPDKGVWARERLVEFINRSQGIDEYFVACSCGHENYIDDGSCRRCRKPLWGEALAQERFELGLVLANLADAKMEEATRPETPPPATKRRKKTP
jgi:hypothetical protein